MLKGDQQTVTATDIIQALNLSTLRRTAGGQTAAEPGKSQI